MLRPFQWMLLFLWGSSLLLCGCRGRSMDVDVSGIEADIEVERFDIGLFGVSPDSPESAIG